MYLITEAKYKVTHRDENDTPDDWARVWDVPKGVCNKKATAKAYIRAEAEEYLKKHHLTGDNVSELDCYDEYSFSIDYGDISIVYWCEKVELFD